MRFQNSEFLELLLTECFLFFTPFFFKLETVVYEKPRTLGKKAEGTGMATAVPRPEYH